MLNRKKNNGQVCKVEMAKDEVTKKCLKESIVENNLLKFILLMGIVISLKIIFVQLLIVLKKLNKINDNLIFVDEVDLDDLEIELDELD